MTSKNIKTFSSRLIVSNRSCLLQGEEAPPMVGGSGRQPGKQYQGRGRKRHRDEDEVMDFDGDDTEDTMM